jgi:hypothetical protein
MTTWTPEDLTTIGTAEEVAVVTHRSDGTLGRPVTIWIVRLGDDLYVRSVNGRDGAWFRGTQRSADGQLHTGDRNYDVSFVAANLALNDQLDAAYRHKYRRYPSSVDHIISPAARAATLKVLPRVGAVSHP